jgi:hypothetical protein
LKLGALEPRNCSFKLNKPADQKEIEVVTFFRRKKEKRRKEPAAADHRQKAVSKSDDAKKEPAHPALADKGKTETTNRLLVVGRESVFSEEIIDYAIEMAERLTYGIIALNTAPLSCDTFRLFSSSRKQICEDFEGLSKKNSLAFQQRAQEKGIPFTHVVKFSDSYEVLKEIKAEIGEFEFVVSEVEEDSVDASTAGSGEKPKREISVYSIM